MRIDPDLNKSWLNGTWEVSDGTVTINTGLPSVTYGDFHVSEHRAEEILNQIHTDWVDGINPLSHYIETWAQSIYND